MKSVTNSNRVPFQVKRYGHDEGLRSSSVTVIAVRPAGGRRGQGRLRLQDARRPQHADDVGGRARAEAEDQVGRRDGRRRRRGLEHLTQAAGAQLDLRADAAAIADARRQRARAATCSGCRRRFARRCSVAAPIADRRRRCRRRRRDRRAPSPGTASSRCRRERPEAAPRRSTPASGRRRCCGTAAGVRPDSISRSSSPSLS